MVNGSQKTAGVVAQILGLSERQIWRLLKAYPANGADANRSGATICVLGYADHSQRSPAIGSDPEETEKDTPIG